MSARPPLPGSPLGARPSGETLERMRRSPHFGGGRFHNPVPTAMMKGSPWSTMRAFFTDRRARTPSSALPVQDPLPAWAAPPASGSRVTWLGHSTLYLELDGATVLTDPMWSDRSSPFARVGPHRFQPAAAPISALPRLDAVVISHDHYDHLDRPTVVELARRRPRFIVPLGVGAHLASWGIREEDISELDWWESAEAGALQITAAPARHFSGRGLRDRNRTLWASFAIRSPRRSVFFSGDTGLYDGFAEVRERLGPFELMALEIGAWHPNWGDIHLGPENALALQTLLGGAPLLPIHWATFDLGVHAWPEPGEDLWRLARERGASLLTPKLGEPVEPARPPPPEPWWRSMGG